MFACTMCILFHMYSCGLGLGLGTAGLDYKTVFMISFLISKTNKTEQPSYKDSFLIQQNQWIIYLQ